VDLKPAEVRLLGELLRGEQKKTPVRACISLVRKRLAAWREPEGYIVLTARGNAAARELWPDIEPRNLQAAEERFVGHAVSRQMALGLPDAPRGPLTAEYALARVVSPGSTRDGAEQLARVLLESYPDGRGLASASTDALEALGLAPSQAEAVVAAFGLARACRQGYDARRPRIDSPADMARAVVIHGDVADLEVECLWVGAVDQGRRITSIDLVGQGGLNKVDVVLRDIFTPLIRVRAAAFFLAHNHPSGVLQASKSDFLITQRAAAMGKALGLDYIDHVILAPSGDFICIEDGGGQ